jgi:hypothetical protein
MEWLRFRNDTAKERFEKCQAIAKEHTHLTKSWERCLECLKNLAANYKAYVDVYVDFSPLSFNWGLIQENGTCPYNGGLIFHGPHDGFGSGEAPTFSVSISPEHGWSIHT